MPRHQVFLAVIGGVCLGLVLGAVVGAALGRQFAPVASWQERELYGFLAFATRIRSMGIGAGIGAMTGAVMGSLLAIWPRRTRQAPSKKI
ncbi:MAG: hypothetical protein ACYC0X_33495 [Pirellulaceae bacterium]